VIRSGVALAVDADYRRVLPAVGRDADAEFVEVPMEGRHRPRRLREEAGELGTLAETYGLDIVVDLPLSADLASPSEQVRGGSRQLCQDAIEVAAAVDASKATLVPRTGALESAYDDVELRGRFVELALDLDSYADHAGVELCVSLSDLLPFERMDPLIERDVAVCLDTVRARATDLDPARLRDRRDAVSHVHLGGLPGVSPAAPGGGDHASGVDDGTEAYVRALGHDWAGSVTFDAGDGPGPIPERLRSTRPTAR
jgi:sugar phosphate isomerase/epimerase